MRRLFGLVVVAVFPFTTLLAAEPKEGIRPVGADGKPLNLDFETGTLKDWTPDGEAFHGQPIKGDTVARRRGDMKSQHQGDYWIGGYERNGDKPQGTLTSVPFKVTHPWASFLIGGGPWPETCVELVRNDTKKVFSRTSGIEEENLRRVAVDLKPHMGKEIFIRLVDKHSGGWGHINFDDFRFHAEKPNVPMRKGPAPPDVYKNAGLPPEKAAAVMTAPEGFVVTLFAGEPDVCQPIAFCLDDRGRLWVAEAYSYPIRRSDKEAKDRILIFEDTNGDGKFDKRTVFMEGLNLVSGLEVGFGGVWIGAAPYLMFVPVNPGADKPAGKPQILLDGWHYEDTHETLNAFRWGPDGWLYGCHGVFTYSRVGKPGTPDKDRVPLNAGVWRYHPTKHVFEVFAHGTSNPWGLDFDAHGQAFVEACVIPHAFHIIQGGRYQRQSGSHFNPYTYADIQTIADHLHWQGANPWAGNASSDSTGGGHAHCGLMIYQGGAWPEEYRGKMFMGNIHGHRINMDVLKPKGSGFVASHGPDFLLANDAWSRFINLRYGPDGNVYLLDWYDKQACHHRDPNIWDRGNGRVYKISYRGTKPVTSVDLSKKSDKELVELLLHKNEWFVRHARRLLQERAANKKFDAGTQEALAKIAFEHEDETRRLRGLWALHAIGGLTEERILRGLADKGAYVRAWTVQLAAENGKLSPKVGGRLSEMARKDVSPIVRLYLASAAQRMADTGGRDLIAHDDSLTTRKEDVADPNLPLMYWYALEATVAALETKDLDGVGPLYDNCRIPLLREFLVRRVASIGSPEALKIVVHFLAKNPSESSERKLILRNILAGLKGRRRVDKPDGWDEVSAKQGLLHAKDAELRSLARSLAVVFGDAAALRLMRQELASIDGDMGARRAALAALLDARDKDLPPVLHRLIGEKELRGAALRGLASYDDPRTPQVILQAFDSFSPAEKRDALVTLASRAAYGKALMESVAAKKVPASDVPAEIVRQLRNLRDKTLDERIAKVWGIVRTTPAERVKLIADWKKKLTDPAPAADLALGRAVFAKTCQQCHTLHGVGGKVGPDITGSNRANLDYLLENILDPSAVIPNDYKLTVLTLKNGQIINGIVRAETSAALTVVTANETLTVPANDVEEREPSPASMMPDDLIKPLRAEEVRALIAYLRHPAQTPILATPENAKDFFNGKDLTGWDGDAKLWSVENGEIVGKSPGLKRNEFLKSQMSAGDFRLTLKMKLTPNKENSGIQFRSEPLPSGEMKGPQADAGTGWWGKLYEESARGLLWSRSGEEHVKTDGWNEYEIVAEGSRVRTYINGKLCVDLNDAALSRRGIFGLQIHAGGPMEVRFKDLKLEVLPTPKSKPGE
ncbi:MAG TPA: PVC-type heme-binding CxxCH protein [Gemmataceae bacterium]|jgi:putative membrane-bound dehydrogenase-like protein